MNIKILLKMQNIPYNFFEWSRDELFEARTQKGGGGTKNLFVMQKMIVCKKKTVKMLVFPIMSRCPFCINLIEVHR